jgi:hypothetical protein
LPYKPFSDILRAVCDNTIPEWERQGVFHFERGSHIWGLKTRQKPDFIEITGSLLLFRRICPPSTAYGRAPDRSNSWSVDVDVMWTDVDTVWTYCGFTVDLSICGSPPTLQIRLLTAKEHSFCLFGVLLLCKTYQKFFYEIKVRYNQRNHSMERRKKQNGRPSQSTS